MARIVVVEDSVRKSIDGLVSEASWAVGLILGQKTDQCDYVIHLARTPSAENSSGKEEHTLEKESKPQKSSRGPKQSVNKLEDWSPNLIARHAKQVSRMLLGGFDVLGVFVCSPAADSLQGNMLSVVRQMLTEIRKTSDSYQYYEKVDSPEKLVLHISCTPHRITCKTIDPATLAGPKPAEIKFPTSPTNWHRFHCRVAMALSLPMSKEKTKNGLIEQIEVGLKPFCENIKRALTTIDGCVRDPAEVLDSGGKNKRKKPKDANPIVQSSHEVDFLIDLNSNYMGEEDILEELCGASMQIRGTIAGRTYVPDKSTIGDGIKCLKLDVLRSLISRCNIHCEDLLVIDGEQQDRVIIHELPCRIFAPFPDLELSFSDYLFPGEKPEDSLEAFTELMSLSLDAETIDTDAERFPDSADLTPPSEEPGNIGVPVAELLPPKAPQSCNYIFIGLSVAISMVAGGVSFYLLHE